MKFHEAMFVNLAIDISPEDLAVLEVLARQRRCSVEEIIIEAIAVFVVAKSQRI